jgi:hypothetical protein
MSFRYMNLNRSGYLSLLAAYRERFSDVPPSILSDEGAAILMAQALHRGFRITEDDLAPPTDVDGDLADPETNRKSGNILQSFRAAERRA